MEIDVQQADALSRLSQGDGQVGTPIGRGDNGNQPGPAGELPGQHIMEVELTLAELAEILGEELALPRIEPKGKRNVDGEVVRYTGVRRVGPESLRHFKRTYRAALKRQLASGNYNPDHPVIIPIRDDRRYRSWRVYPRPHNNAIVFYMMDVSGSMTNKKKELVRLTAFWIDTWLQAQYKNLQVRYIVHDAAAKEVDQHTFYHTRESGGTKISSAFNKALQIVNAQYSSQEWNVYYFHFSDGDNWSVGDTNACIQMLKEEILPDANLFCYGQVKSMYGSGQFIKDLENELPEPENLIISKIDTKDEIMDSIKTFLGKGK